MIVQFVSYAWNKKVLLHTLVPDLGLFEPPHHYIQDLSSRFLAKSEFFGFNGLHTWYQGYPRVPNPLRPQVHGFLWISYPLNTVCIIIRCSHRAAAELFASELLSLPVWAEFLKSLIYRAVKKVSKNWSFLKKKNPSFGQYINEYNNLRFSFAAQVHPWFVSDTRQRDIDWMLDQMLEGGKQFRHNNPDGAPVTGSRQFNKKSDPVFNQKDVEVMAKMKKLAEKWKNYLTVGSWIVVADPYWTYPHDFRSVLFQIVRKITRSSIYKCWKKCTKAIQWYKHQHLPC